MGLFYAFWAEGLFPETLTWLDFKIMKQVFEVYVLVEALDFKVFCSLQRGTVLYVLQYAGDLRHGEPLACSPGPPLLRLSHELVEAVLELRAFLIEEGRDEVVLVDRVASQQKITAEAVGEGHLGHTDQAAPPDVRVKGFAVCHTVAFAVAEPSDALMVFLGLFDRRMSLSEDVVSLRGTGGGMRLEQPSRQFFDVFGMVRQIGAE